RGAGRRVPPGREAPAVAPHDRAAERPDDRHQAAGHPRRPEGAALSDHLARRRRARRLVPRPLHGERAGARDPASPRHPGGEDAHLEALGDADLERLLPALDAAAAEGPLRARGGGAGRRRQPLAAPALRDRADPLRDARAEPRRRGAARTLRDPRLDRRADGRVALRPRLGRPADGHAPLPGTRQARRVPPVRDGAQPQRGLCGGGGVNAHTAQALGAVGAVGLAVLLAATQRQARIAGLAAWAIGWVGVAVYLAPHGHHRLLAAAAVVGAAGAAAGAALVVRVPWLLAVAVLACVPARFPVHVGSTKANLLLPIYAVVAVAALALAWDLFGDGERSRPLGPLARPLAGLVAWQGLSFLWTNDVRQGAIELAFFVLPFGLLAAALARLPWSRAWVLALYVQLAFMGLLFAVIGIWQYETRNIFWNPKVKVDNAYAPSGWFYRVNSVFYDPSIYGRFL